MLAAYDLNNECATQTETPAYLTKWLVSPPRLKFKMTQFTGVLLAHAQPCLYAMLVYETKSAPAMTGTIKELPQFLNRPPG